MAWDTFQGRGLGNILSKKREWHQRISKYISFQSAFTCFGICILLTNVGAFTTQFFKEGALSSFCDW